MSEEEKIGCFSLFITIILSTGVYVLLIFGLNGKAKKEKPNIEEFEKLTRYPKKIFQ